MGAGIFSSGAGNYDGGGSNSQSSETGLGDIPEGCISYLSMSFDPQEICQLARVNKAFQRASSRDFVWESKLPQTYKFLLNKVLGEENLGTMIKKDLFQTMSTQFLSLWYKRNLDGQMQWTSLSVHFMITLQVNRN